MSDENKIRDAADAVKGIVEAVPVYQDALQPAAKEIGTALQTVAKATRVALAPLSAIVWGYDRISEYLEKALIDKLKEVAPERIKTPDPAVAGPAVEALRFTAHEPALRELFANLLATAMNADSAEKSHPAFVDIIRQMAPDEALIFELVGAQIAFYSLKIDHELSDNTRVTSYDQYQRLNNSLTHPQLILSGLNNLSRLGLITITQLPERIVYRVSTEGEVLLSLKDAFDHPYPQYLIEQLQKRGLDMEEECESILKNERVRRPTERVVRFDIQAEEIRLTALGHRFYDACVGRLL
jgi:DNA-binding PadR family transcriptional regulator